MLASSVVLSREQIPGCRRPDSRQESVLLMGGGVIRPGKPRCVTYHCLKGRMEGGNPGGSPCSPDRCRGRSSPNERPHWTPVLEQADKHLSTPVVSVLPDSRDDALGRAFALGGDEGCNTVTMGCASAR
jgi:hypothetical protein